MRKFMGNLTVAAVLGLIGGVSHAADPADYWKLEAVATPPHLSPEIGGMDTLDDGRIAVAFHSGEVYFFNPATHEWKLFAAGLHDPLGLVVINDREIVTMQRPELTRVRDTDGDGTADDYTNLTDDFGLTGNYHEFAFGPARDKEGNFYVALNTGSRGAGIWHEMRGQYSKAGHGGRMYSAVPYRGWVLKVTPEGKMTPYASGFRSPDGIGFDCAGRLIVTENQGDWVGTSRLLVVEEGGFHGHPASLVWKKGYENIDPPNMDPAMLDRMRVHPAVLFPHGIVANSPSQPLCIPDNGKFPFAGQFLVGEMNAPRIMRIMLEEVEGQMQGASVALYENAGLLLGNHRFTFTDDGALWIGLTMRGHWAGAKGIQRLTWNGKMPLEVQNMSIRPDGFELTFTNALDAATADDPANYKFKRYRYAYHETYGSPQLDMADVPVTKAALSSDGKRVRLTLGEPLRGGGFVYELTLKNVRDQSGADVLHPYVVYTVNVVPKK